VSTLAEFSRRIAAIDVVGNINRGMHEVAIAVDQTVVLATPVDTGRARSNWLVQLDSPTNDTVEPAGVGEAATQPSIDAAKATIKTYDCRANTAIHITNNLPYIEPLNNGHSAQAPAGYVEQAIQAGVEAVRNIRVLNDN
jgi:hypothetical protein